MVHQFRQDLKEFLKKLPTDRWKSARCAAPLCDTVRWLPIGVLTPIPGEYPNIHFGLSTDGTWVTASSDGSLTDIDKSQYFWPLFGVLEMPYSDAKRAVEHELELSEVGPEWLAAFPFEGLLIAALRSGSRHWPDDAITWLESFPPSTELQSAVEFLEKNGQTQRQRHKARSWLAKHRKSRPIQRS